MFAFATPAPPPRGFKTAALNKRCASQIRRPQLPVLSVATSDRLSKIRLPRTLRSTTEVFQDARGIKWDFTMEVFEPSKSHERETPRSPIIFTHPPDGLGSTRFYWDRVLAVMAENPSLFAAHEVVRFDWIGASRSHASLSRPPAPTTPQILAAQLYYIAAQFDTPVIVVGQGGAEPILLKFAYENPGSVKACVICTGFPTAFITRPPNAILRKVLYALGCSFLGRLFWNYASTRKFITDFSRKNLFRKDEWLNEWVTRITASAAENANARFLTFSGLSGHFFGDFTKELAGISTPWLFLAGDEDPSMASNRLQRPKGLAFMRSDKERKKETTVDRGNVRRSLMQNCTLEVVKGAGVQMVFEDTEIVLSVISEFVDRQWNTSRSTYPPKIYF